MNIKARALLEALSSVKLTLVCLALSMILVLIGTLAQVDMGTFAAQKEYFHSWWIVTHKPGFPLPVFPGGLTVGSIWIVNLLAAFAARFKYRRKEAGILLSHFGVILLMLGQLLTQLMARESNMPVEIGHSSNYSESFKDTELAVVMTSDPTTDTVTSIPYSRFSRRGPIIIPSLPFTIVIQTFYPNAQLGMMASSGDSLATQGIGTRISAQEIPVTHSDEEMNAVTAMVEVIASGKSLGTWLLSSGLGAPQSFTVEGKTYEMFIRPRRYYFPFHLTLNDFRHDVYPGTDIPKNFSSRVQLRNPTTGEKRDALIYMNHPLRYEGKTFYQASFGKGDRVSVFQVVENPVAWAPYISCLLVILGLAIQFLMHLLEFLKKRT